jgi:hypothetical protein
VATRFPPGGPSWLGVEPLCLAISCRGRCFLLYRCALWFCRWRPWVRSPLRCEVSRGSGGGDFFLPVAGLRCRVLVGALWRVEGALCESAQWVCLCLVMPFDSSWRHTGVVASSRPRATLRQPPRRRWCRCVGWSRLRASLRLCRRCSVVAKSRRSNAVRLLRRGLELWCPSCVSLGSSL